MVTPLSMAMPRSRTVDDGVTRSAPTLTAADGRLSRLRVVDGQWSLSSFFVTSLNYLDNNSTVVAYWRLILCQQWLNLLTYLLLTLNWLFSYICRDDNCLSLFVQNGCVNFTQRYMSKKVRFSYLLQLNVQKWIFFCSK